MSSAANDARPASLFTPWTYSMTSAPFSTAPLHAVAFSVYAAHGWLDAYRNMLDAYRDALRRQQDAMLGMIEGYVARTEARQPIPNASEGAEAPADAKARRS